MKLNNKRALITGSSRGIGLAIVQALAKEGVKLFITARDGIALEGIKRELVCIETQIEYASADLANPIQVEGMFSKAIEFLGGIDILINNAGIGLKANVIETDLAAWDELCAINLRAPFILSKLAGKLMVSQGSGYIINIGSGASQNPISEHAAYCASKHGLLGFSESMALEVREHGVKVSIILPGSTATYFGNSSPDDKLASKPGMLRSEDVADAVLFLLRQAPQAWTSIMNLRPLNLSKP